MDLDAIADPSRKARFRFDIRMFDKAGLKRAFGDTVGAGHRGIDIACDNAAAHENIFRTVEMDKFGTAFQGSFRRCQRRQFLPGHGEIIERQSLYAGVANNCRNGFSAEACFAFREDWLIGEGRNDAVAILAGHILCREDAYYVGVLCGKSGKIAQCKASAVVRASNDANDECTRRESICAIQFGTVDFR